MPCEPGVRKHRKSLPGILLALRNSPLAQSPMICMPALPLITMPEATFQSRPEKSLSTSLRSCDMRWNTFSVVGELSALGSSSMNALR